MGKLVFIHLDNQSPVWGDGKNLSFNDLKFRSNIHIQWESDASGNLKNSNSGGDLLYYTSNGFATKRPVRVVGEKSSTSFLDLATLNSGISGLCQAYKYPNTSNNNLSVDTAGQNSAPNGFYSMFGWLNETPKKADGTDATTDGEAVYYELIILSKRLVSPYDFVGIGYKSVTSPFSWANNSGTKRFHSIAGFVALNNSTFAIENGNMGGRVGSEVIHAGWNGGYDINDAFNLTIDVCGINGVNDNKQFINDGLYTSINADNLIRSWTNSDIISFEINNSGLGVVNRTTNEIIKLESTALINNSTSRFSPAFFITVNFAGEFRRTLDDISLVGFDDILV